MRLVKWLCLIGGLGCMLAACSNAPTPTEPSPAQFKQIFFETFENKNNYWQETEDDKLGKAAYDADNQFRIKVSQAKTHIWSYPIAPATLSLGDVTVSVKARTDDGDINNLYGVFCRYRNQENFYFFVISSDGYFGIGKMIKGKYQLINRNDYPPSSAILKKAQTNTIRAECIKSTLSLYVNDQLVDQQTDADLISGRVGLIAAALGGTTEVVFDDFEVRGP